MPLYNGVTEADFQELGKHEVDKLKLTGMRGIHTVNLPLSVVSVSCDLLRWIFGGIGVLGRNGLDQD